MLVLSRKLNESVMIGDDVCVTVCHISGDRVRIGIEAPKGTAVHRREVYDAIKRKQTDGPTEQPQDGRPN